jgi:hypothetical protein
MIREWEGFLKDALHRADNQDFTNQTGVNKLILHDGKQYNEYKDPFHLMANRVWEDIQNYDSTLDLKYSVSSKKLHKSIPNLS